MDLVKDSAIKDFGLNEATFDSFKLEINFKDDFDNPKSDYEDQVRKFFKENRKARYYGKVKRNHTVYHFFSVRTKTKDRNGNRFYVYLILEDIALIIGYTEYKDEGIHSYGFSGEKTAENYFKALAFKS